MNKKVTTLIICTSCLFLLSVVIIVNLIQSGTIDIDSMSSSLSKNTNSTSSENTTNNSKENINSPLYEMLLGEGAEHTINYVDEKYDIGEFGDLIVKYNSLSISKERGNFDICGDFKEIKDDNGNIVNEFSYVIVDITLVNKGERIFEAPINCLNLGVGMNYGISELRSYNSGKAQIKVKDYYVTTLQPDKEYNFTLAFIIDDDLIEQYKNELYIYVSFIQPRNTVGEREILLIKKDDGE